MKLLPAPELPHSAQIPEKKHFHLTANMSQREGTNLRKSRLGRKDACRTLSAHWSTTELQHFVPCTELINQNLYGA